MIQKKNKGITLIVLVVAIVVLLILAGVTITLMIGDNGIITKAKEAAFREEMQDVKEKVDLINTVEVFRSYSEITSSSEYEYEEISLEESKKFDNTLKCEIMLWSKWEYDVSELSKSYIEKNWEKIANVDANNNLKNVYYLEDNDGKMNYIYSKNADIVFKIKVTKIGSYQVHSVEELDYQKGKLNERSTQRVYTKIEAESQLVTVNSLTYYEPDLSNFAYETTNLEYYTKAKDDTSLFETVDVNTYLSSPANERKRVSDSGSIWYDYADKIWANIKIDNLNGIEGWFVWVPRYAYKNDGTETSIVFIDIDNNPTDGSTFDTSYTVASAFYGNTKKGIWVGKYESSFIANGEIGDFAFYIPDLTNFNKEKVYIEIYDKDSNTFTEEIQASSVDNMNNLAKEKCWFDYENKIWANIKIKTDNGQEGWFVWIPRYAYKIQGTDTDIVFIDTTDQPIDGSTLGSGYEVAAAFKGNTKKGIWVGKYESQYLETNDFIINTTPNEPNLTGFNVKTTYIIPYNTSTKEMGNKILLNDIISNSSSVQNDILVSGSIDTAKLNKKLSKNEVWYNYADKIWANIKIDNLNGIEGWFVWIPRYAYRNAENMTDVLFLTAGTNKYNGDNDLPNDYNVAATFLENEKVGIWTAKYESSRIETSD